MPSPMPLSGGLSVRRATERDIPTLIHVRNLAFETDYKRYGYCPAYNITPGHMQTILDTAQVYLILLHGQPIGDMSARETAPWEYFLGCLSIIPQQQGKGYGGVALEWLHAQFPHAKCWALETPADKTQNIRFYQKHGYTIVNEYEDTGVAVAKLLRPAR